MFEELTTWQVLAKGGWTLILLIFCSVLCMAVILEKGWSLRKLDFSHRLLDRIFLAISESDAKTILTLAEKNNPGGPLQRALAHCVAFKERGASAMKAAAARQISLESLHLEKRLGILGTVGAVAPFIGLFGTVLGIMRAFHDLGKFGAGNPAIVSTGIAEALIATAAGLLVAVPSVVFYNYFSRKVQVLATRWQAALEGASDLVGKE